MLTAQQAAAKAAAHKIFDYPARQQALSIGDERRLDSLPPFKAGVEGIGVAQDAVRVYVQEEHDLDIPDEIAGMPVQRVSTPGFRIDSLPRRSRLRPAPGGVSIGHATVPTGTLGCLVDVAGVRYVLSNNHVIACTNGADIGDDILQPGPQDIKGPVDPARYRIAELADFEPIRFGSAVNEVDAAIGKVSDMASAVPGIMALGTPTNPPLAAFVGQSVAKHGRTTGLTFGTVVDISFDGKVGYNGRTAYFEDQVGIVGIDGRPFSSPGDSGSLVVETDRAAPVGLLFAGDGSQTIANPIGFVLNRFGATVVTG